MFPPALHAAGSYLAQVCVLLHLEPSSRTKCLPVLSVLHAQNYRQFGLKIPQTLCVQPPKCRYPPHTPADRSPGLHPLEREHTRYLPGAVLEFLVGRSSSRGRPSSSLHLEQWSSPQTWNRLQSHEAASRLPGQLHPVPAGSLLPQSLGCLFLQGPFCAAQPLRLDERHLGATWPMCPFYS